MVPTPRWSLWAQAEGLRNRPPHAQAGSPSQCPELWNPRPGEMQTHGGPQPLVQGCAHRLPGCCCGGRGLHIVTWPSRSLGPSSDVCGFKSSDCSGDWLSWLSIGPSTKRLPVRFLIRAQARDVSLISGGGPCRRQPILVPLSHRCLSLLLPSSLFKK